MTPDLMAVIDDPADVLSISNLSKAFPGTLALDRASIDVGASEIHALVGQNGSGKSTLVKILAGYHSADPGYVATLNGEALDLGHQNGKRHQELRFVHQDLGLILELSAADNLALRSEFLKGPAGLISWKQQRDLARELLAKFDLELDVSRPMGEATPVQRTVVAIAAALAGWDGGPGLLVLDEPTAVLPPAEVGKLLATVEQVRQQGTSVLYISHRLDEIFRVADRVSVLRGGRVVATSDVDQLTAQDLAQLMVGSGVDAKFRADVPVRTGERVVLEARAMSGRFLDGVDVELHEGEILGLAGLPGSGSNELPYTLAGANDRAEGHLRRGQEQWVPAHRARRLAVPIVPADRVREAVVGEFSVRINLSLSVLSRLRRRGLLSKSRETSLVLDWIDRTDIKTASPDEPITSLSGGNQQKVVIARSLATESGVLLLCEPTAGVDVGARQAIYEIIADRARNGLSVIVSSSDTGDLVAICSRILVFVDGRIARELVGDEITEEAVLHAMEEAA